MSSTFTPTACPSCDSLVRGTPPPLLRLKEAAAYLSVSTWTMRQMVRRGEVAFIQRTPYSPLLFEQADLEAWKDKHKRHASLC